MLPLHLKPRIPSFSLSMQAAADAVQAPVTPSINRQVVRRMPGLAR